MYLNSKKNKFGAKRQTHPVHGKFDSKGEMERFLFLEQLRMAGLIEGQIERQISFDLVVSGKKICRYVADFRYTRDGEEVIEDFKGVMTPTSKLKIKLFEALYGKKIHIVKKTKEW